MKNKKVIIIAALVTLIVISIVGTWAFSKYTSTLTGAGSATVAKWSFKANGSTSTIANVTLTDTTLNSKVTDGKIAPGTDGSFNVSVDGTGSEVAIEYIIEISDLTNIPTNLKFYSDSAFTTPLVSEGGKYTFTGEIALASINTAVNKTIYWKWDYETGTNATNIASNDVIDKSSAGQTAGFTITVTGIQQDPSIA